MKCPYCGAEMKELTSYAQVSEFGKGWYGCPKCKATHYPGQVKGKKVPKYG